VDKEKLSAMSKRIKQRRKDFGYTQEKMAEMLGISYSSYSKIENAFQKPSLDTLIGISVCLKVPLDELIFGQNESVNEDAAKINALMTILKSCDSEKLLYTNDLLGKILSCLK